MTGVDEDDDVSENSYTIKTPSHSEQWELELNTLSASFVGFSSAQRCAEPGMSVHGVL
jgi:hypothetical protein